MARDETVVNGNNNEAGSSSPSDVERRVWERWGVVCDDPSRIRCVSSYFQGVACGTGFLLPRSIRCRRATEEEWRDEEERERNRGHDHSRDDGVVVEGSFPGSQDRPREGAENEKPPWRCVVKERWIHSVRIDESTGKCTVDVSDSVEYYCISIVAVLVFALFMVLATILARCASVALSVGHNTMYAHSITNLFISKGSRLKEVSFAGKSSRYDVVRRGESSRDKKKKSSRGALQTV